MRVAIYARVSTENQEKQETINSQVEALRDYAQKNNHVICEEYKDEGYSGEILDRPALDKLRDDVKKKLFETVLIHSPDRLSRKYIYTGLVLEEFKKQGANVIFLNRPDSKNTPEDNLLEGVQGLIAEFEKAKILERTRRGKMHKVRSGKLLGHTAPYGYRYIQGDQAHNVLGRYEICPDEAKVVKLIFELYARGLSMNRVAVELTERGIAPQRGIHWRTSTLHRIIRNETYIGTTYYNKSKSIEPVKNGSKYRRLKNTSRKIRPKDEWIQIKLSEELKIIDKKTFLIAQKQIKRNSELSPRNVKYSYLLRGLIKCGECDSPFVGCPTHGKLYYRCANRGRTFPLPKECGAGTVNASMIENAVWNKFCEAIKNPHLIMSHVGKLRDKQIKAKPTTKDIESMEKAIAVTMDEENRLLDAYRGGIVSLEQLKVQMAKIQAKREQLDQEKQGLLANSEPSLAPVVVKKTIHDYCGQIAKRLDGLEGDFQGKSHLLHLAFNRITLKGKEVRIRGIIPTYPEEPLQNSSNIASTLSL